MISSYYGHCYLIICSLKLIEIRKRWKVPITKRGPILDNFIRISKQIKNKLVLIYVKRRGVAVVAL
jgi:hypothetical protein